METDYVLCEAKTGGLEMQNILLTTVLYDWV